MNNPSTIHPNHKKSSITIQTCGLNMMIVIEEFIPAYPKDPSKPRPRRTSNNHDMVVSMAMGVPHWIFVRENPI